MMARAPSEADRDLSRLPGRICGSFVARIAAILAIGVAFASISSFLVAEQSRLRELRDLRIDRVMTSTLDIARRLRTDPRHTQDLLRGNRILGVRDVGSRSFQITADPGFDRAIAGHLPPGESAVAMQMPAHACFGRMDLSVQVAGTSGGHLPECWLVDLRHGRGEHSRLLLDFTDFKIRRSPTVGMAFLVSILAISVILSILVARVATAPLRRLAEAARLFSMTMEPERIAETGPHEVRAAIESFNHMQQRVQDGFKERSRLLASITHDLQTPLTRLRLRLEQVSDQTIRLSLINDLLLMQRLVQDGLDLAQNHESREPWSPVEIDSLLSSLAEDAADLGRPVRLAGSCQAIARVKPYALTRCLDNLIDNAIKYGGGAELTCAVENGKVIITVRDHGPGIPHAALEAAFEPFCRLPQGRQQAPTGTGLGLAIARAQAQTFGATVSLSNHQDGGLSARIHLAGLHPMTSPIDDVTRVLTEAS